MSIWRGIGYHIDSAFQYKDGNNLISRFYKNIHNAFASGKLIYRCSHAQTIDRWIIIRNLYTAIFILIICLFFFFFSFFSFFFVHFICVSGWIGKTYFFKGKSYWQFNDSRMHVTQNRPDSSAIRWMGCPRVTATYSNEVYDDEELQQKEPLTAAAPIISTNHIVLLVCGVFLLSQF